MISLSGLASGMDTDSIITQLMTVERQPRTRLELADTRAQARQTGLRDLATKLGAVRDAANALKSSTTWADVQQLASSDPARVAVRTAGGAAPGAHTIAVTALATTAQHAFDYASSASPQTIGIDYVAVDPDTQLPTPKTFSLAVDPNSTIATVAASINDRDDSPVKAVVAGGKLVLTSRTGGAGGDFTVSASSPLVELPAYARAGTDAAYELDGDGVVRHSSSNVVNDAILGVELTLKSTTAAPVSLTVSDPAPDTEAIKAKVSAFVTAYNSALDYMRTKVKEEVVKNPTTTTEATKGLFHGDTMLTSALSSMRSSIGDLAKFGISTGSASGSATFSADAVAGKLKVDDTKLNAAIADDRETLRTALNGLGQRLSDVVTPVAGERVTARLDSITDERKRLSDAIARTDTRLASREQRLRAQFAAMESALAASQAAQSQLSSQLAALG
ncbi:MAG: flagellar filament capping protein FliD [Solirubrobacteraceae bacterium]